MFYILLIIILLSIIYLKKNELEKNYLTEDFTNLNILNEHGLSLKIQENYKYSLGSGEINTPYFNIAYLLSDIFNIDMSVVNSEGSIKNLDYVNSKNFDFAIVQEDILYEEVIKKGNYKNVRFLTALHDELYFLIVKNNSI